MREEKRRLKFFILLERIGSNGDRWGLCVSNDSSWVRLRNSGERTNYRD